MTVAADALMRQVRCVPKSEVRRSCRAVLGNSDSKNTEKSKILLWLGSKGSLVGRAARVKKIFEPPHETFPAFFKTLETMP
jgi:hypothetical protein